MAKKRRRMGGEPAQEAESKQVVEESADTVAVVAGGLDFTLALKAVRWLADNIGRGDEVEDDLSLAIRPLVELRAAQYEEGAKVVNKAAPSHSQNGKKRPPIRPLGDGVGGAIGGLELQGSEVATASEALRKLAAAPEALTLKVCKPLRAALHPLVEAHIRESRSSPTFRITCILGQRTRWVEALPLLTQMRGLEARRRPKLGAYQRWIRELNVAKGDPQELVMLDAIMRVAAGFPPSTASLSSLSEGGKMELFPAWEPMQLPPTAVASGEMEPAASGSPVVSSTAPAPVDESVDTDRHVSVANRMLSLIKERKAETIAAKAEEELATPQASFNIVAHEAAHERKPPNRYDLDIFSCLDFTLSASSTSAGFTRQRRPVARHELPGVSGAAVLTDVMSVEECDALREASERIGYRPDVPLSSAIDERAHNVVLLASESQNDAIFERVRLSLPAVLGGDKLFGLNRRWRLYRYETGNLYRKHLDGAWPGSGMRRGLNGVEEYAYDAHGGATRSRLTFIIYLNDNFEGGATTFYVPKPSVEGVLEARPVKARIGSASVFPHGDTGVPLLHEGSSVCRGRKYLLRTDVLYVSPHDPAMLREAQRIRGLKRQLGLADTASGEVAGDNISAGDGGSDALKTKGKKKPRLRDENLAKRKDSKPGGALAGVKTKGTCNAKK